MTPVIAIALGGAVLAAGGLSTLIRASWVGGSPDAWTVVVRDGAVVRAGVGLSGLVRPTDQVVTFSAAVQRVRFTAPFVDADLLQAELAAFALWSVDPADPLVAYRRLGLVEAARQPSGHLLTRAQHHAFQQALAALVRRHGGAFRYAELATDPAPLLQRVLADARAQLAELGVVVEDLQLLGLQPGTAQLADVLAAPVAEAAQRAADEARDASRRARDAQQAAADEAKALAELERRIAVQREHERLAELQREAARRQVEAELALEHERTEAEVARARLRLAVERDKSPELRAHELAVLQTERLSDAVGRLPLSDARLVHVGRPLDGLLSWLTPGEG